MKCAWSFAFWAKSASTAALKLEGKGDRKQSFGALWITPQPCLSSLWLSFKCLCSGFGESKEWPVWGTEGPGEQLAWPLMDT